MTDASAYRFDGIQILVTGATGIVGGRLVRLLLDSECDVVVLLRDEPANAELLRNGDLTRVTRVRGDLADDRLLERILVDYDIGLVFHLGAQTQVGTAHREPLGTLEANVRGTYQLLDAVRRQSRPPAVVVASSDKAYGSSEALPYREDYPLAGRGIYDVSKSAADLIATAYAQSFALPVSIARCGNIYGGGDLNWDRIVPGTIRSLLAGDRPVVRSDGRPRRDYIYVDDAVSAYLCLAASTLAGEINGEAFNFGHNQPISVLEIVDMLRQITGRMDLLPDVRATATLEIPDQYLDSSKAAARLGWRPAFSLEDGLAATVSWYQTILAG